MGGSCLTSLSEAACVLAQATGVPNLRHFVCKFVPAAQYTTCRWAGPYGMPSVAPTVASLGARDGLVAAVKERQAKVLTAYRNIHKKLHCKLHPISSFYQASDTEVFVGSVSRI